MEANRRDGRNEKVDGVAGWWGPGDFPRKGTSCISGFGLSQGALGGSNLYSVSESGEEDSFGETLDEFGSEENTELPTSDEAL